MVAAATWGAAVTVFLRALWGPFGAFEESGGFDFDWHFFGIREDNTMGHWAARFHVPSRTWKTVNFPMDTALKIDGKWTKAGAPAPAFIDAFVPDKPMVYGRTYLDILKPRLSQKDIADASRAVLAGVRR